MKLSVVVHIEGRVRHEIVSDLDVHYQRYVLILWADTTEGYSMAVHLHQDESLLAYKVVVYPMSHEET